MRSDNDKDEAAKLLGISRATLYRELCHLDSES
ncbi:helix-turn-helix domain-containing protein [Bradyrhizobium sp.]